jgi:hypothetical protein
MTENVQSARQIRFTNIEQIIKKKSVIKDYIKEAIEIDARVIKNNNLFLITSFPIVIEFSARSHEFRAGRPLIILTFMSTSAATIRFKKETVKSPILER